MQENDISFLEGCFKKYYFDHFDLIVPPEDIQRREFGYQRFTSGMIRHISLKDEKAMRLLLMNNIPSDVYCSNARYSFPTLPMKEKDWNDAYLIFDIDAKDLNLSCRRDHTVLTCNDCNGVSVPGEKCASCSSARIKPKSLPCNDCITASKGEVLKLIRILEQDFAVNTSDIRTYFSGNEGFHIHVYDSQFQGCSTKERSELTDYVRFRGAMPKTFGMKDRPDRGSFPDMNEAGWRGRFAEHAFGSKSRRPKVIAQMIRDGPESFQKTLEDASEKIGVRIDPGVTMDIHRVFRLPGSLNSKSGMAKIPCGDLRTFNPFAEASLLSDDPTDVMASCPHRFRLRNRRFGPYENDTVTVPAYAAAYMICKGLARIP